MSKLTLTAPALKAANLLRRAQMALNDSEHYYLAGQQGQYGNVEQTLVSLLTSELGAENARRVYALAIETGEDIEWCLATLNREILAESVSEEQAQAVLAAVAARFPHDPDYPPTVRADFDGRPYVVIWPEGPDDWAIGPHSYSIPGVFTEALNPSVLAIYPTDR